MTHRPPPRTDTARDALNRYYTPDNLAARLLDTVWDGHPSDVIVEPHAGGGAFVRAALSGELQPTVYVADLDPDAPCHAIDHPSVRHLGAVDWLTSPLPEDTTMIVANPPFRGYANHVEKIVRYVAAGRVRVAGVLLPESVLSAPAFRRACLINPSEVHHIVGRVPFEGPGVDEGRERKRARLEQEGRPVTRSALQSSPATGHVWVVWRRNPVVGTMTGWIDGWRGLGAVVG